MPLVSKRLDPPIRGWNTLAPIREMEAGYAPRLENVWFDQQSSMRKRAGQIRISEPLPNGEKSLHLFEHFSESGFLSTFVITDAGSLYKYNALNWIKETPTFQRKTRSAKLQNLTLVVDGISPAQYVNDNGVWNTPTTFGAVIPPHIGNIPHTHNGRMYVAGDRFHKMTVYYSATSGNNALGVDYWDSLNIDPSGSQAGFIDVSSAISQGDEITGLTSYKGFLVVFLRNSVVFYQGNDPIVGGFTVAKVVEGVGCISHDSIQGIGNDTIFLSQFGFKTLEQIMVQGDAGIANASVPINNFVIGEISALRIQDENIRSCFASKWGVYLCRFAEITLAYHVLFNAWSSWNGISGDVFESYDGEIHSMDTFLTRFDTNVPADYIGIEDITVETPIILVWETPPFRTSSGENKARWNRVEVVYESQQEDELILHTWVDLDESRRLVSSVLKLSPQQLITDAGSLIWYVTDYDLTSMPPPPPSNLAPTSVYVYASGANDLVGRKWVGGGLGGAPFFAGDKRVPTLGRGELFTMRVIHSSTKAIKLTALEAYYIEASGVR